MRRLLAIIASLGLFLLGCGFAFRSDAPAATKAVSQTLHATVGPGFQIGLSFDDGTPVTNLPAGTYTVQVQDLSPEHNFHLFGPGVDQKTEISTTSEATWTVTFQDQNGYSFQCDAHGSLTGNFTVGNLPAPPAVTSHAPDPPAVTTTERAPLPLRGALAGSVGPKHTISLAQRGKKVTKLQRGIYEFVVSDRSKRDNFSLRQVVGGKSAQQLTPTAFVGTKRVKVELGAGKWKVYSSVREQVVYAFFDVR